MEPAILISVTFGAIGLLQLLSGLFLIMKRRAFFANAEVISGTITGSEMKWNTTDSDINSHSISRFKYAAKFKYNYRGKIYEKTSNITTTTSSGFSKGQKIKILVNPNNPKQAKIKSQSVSMLPKALIIIAAIDIIVAIVLFYIL